jgi:ubiquinone/menaquinone biosynthesis C-methylase UbiE/uncharacterized protein YbaR (Trm112 family)
MYRELVPYLQCPRCASAALDLHVRGEERDEIVAGALRCEQCGSTMPIRDGIVDALVEPLPQNPAQLVNYTRFGAWGYERLWRWQALSLLSGQHFPLRDELRLVRALVAPERGGLVVDAACSTALYGRALVAPSTVVVSVDHAWAMLQEARRYARREGKRMSFVRARVQTLPLRDGCASGYAMGGSLNEVGDIAATLREARRVVAADGRLVSMNLVRAQSAPGRALQNALATGGLLFPDAAGLNRTFAGAGWRLMAQWRWRVVEISLLGYRG